MSETLVSESERAELYRELAVWVAPSVPAIRGSLEEIGYSDLLESNLQAFKVGMVSVMEEMLVGAGHADEARSNGFLVTWDRWTHHREGERWFPSAKLKIVVNREAPSGLAATVPLLKSALDYLLVGMRANQEAVLGSRPDIEVLDGAGRVVSRTRRVKT